jgi:peptide-methionine (S)-S-oxide reductase
MRTLLTAFLFAALATVGCKNAASSKDLSPSAADGSLSSVKPSGLGANPGNAGRGTPLAAAPGHELAAFAQGCFWGSENTYRHVNGVTATAVGYSGGHTEAPTYETVCSHGTGHAEVVLVEFDPKVVSYEKLLATFWTSHDPTTKNRQGPDVGDQYRSAIYTFSPAQEAAARNSMAEEQKHRAKSITTELSPIKAFWKAEDYHQQYDEKTGRESCPLPGARGT